MQGIRQVEHRDKQNNEEINVMGSAGRRNVCGGFLCNKWVESDGIYLQTADLQYNEIIEDRYLSREEHRTQRRQACTKIS